MASRPPRCPLAPSGPPSALQPLTNECQSGGLWHFYCRHLPWQTQGFSQHESCKWTAAKVTTVPSAARPLPRFLPSLLKVCSSEPEHFVFSPNAALLLDVVFTKTVSPEMTHYCCTIITLYRFEVSAISIHCSLNKGQISHTNCKSAVTPVALQSSTYANIKRLIDMFFNLLSHVFISKWIMGTEILCRTERDQIRLWYIVHCQSMSTKSTCFVHWKLFWQNYVKDSLTKIFCSTRNRCYLKPPVSNCKNSDFNLCKTELWWYQQENAYKPAPKPHENINKVYIRYIKALDIKGFGQEKKKKRRLTTEEKLLATGFWKAQQADGDFWWPQFPSTRKKSSK